MEEKWRQNGGCQEPHSRMEAEWRQESSLILRATPTRPYRAYPGTLLHFKLEPFGISTFRLACPVIVQLRRFKVMTQIKKCQVLVH